MVLKCAQVILAVILIFSDIAYAIVLDRTSSSSILSPPSRFSPIVTLEWQDDHYVITENAKVTPQLDNAKTTFPEDAAFIYINLLINQFLQKLSVLGKLGVSQGGLQAALEKEKREHLDLFIKCINDHSPATRENSQRFHFNEMSWNGNAIVLPYSKKDPGSNKVDTAYLYYSLGAAQRITNPDVGQDTIESSSRLPINVSIKSVERKGLVLAPEAGKEDYVLNAGVLLLEGRRFLFARRSIRSDSLVYRSEIGLFEYLDDGQVKPVDREMLVPEMGEDIIALEDARVVEHDGIIYVYLAVVRSNHSCYSVVTTHNAKEFLRVINDGRKSWKWSSFKRLIDDGPCATQNIKSFIPFANGEKDKARALYRPDEKGGSTIRMAVSENGLAGPWKDAGVYHSVPQEAGWLGPSAYLSGDKYDFMLYHRAALRVEDSSKYYDIRLIIADKNDPTRKYLTKPLLIPDLEDPLERDGWVPGAIYTCGAVLKSFDEQAGNYVFDIYYSGADSRIMLATVTVNIKDESAMTPTADMDREKRKAGDFWDELILRTEEAKRNKEILILGLDTSWIQNQAAAQPIISRMNQLPEDLRRLGLDNLVFKYGNGSELASQLAGEKDKTKAKFSNIIVIGSREIIREDRANEFSKLKGATPEDRALLIGVDPSNLTYMSGIRILEMWLLALKLHSGIVPLQSNTDYINIEAVPNREGRVRAFIFTPVKPYDIIESARINRLQIDEINTKA